ELKPHPIEWPKRGREQAGKNEKHRRQRTSPGPRVSDTPKINQREQREGRRHNHAERAVRAGNSGLLAQIAFVRLICHVRWPPTDGILTRRSGKRGENMILLPTEARRAISAIDLRGALDRMHRKEE